MKKTLLAFLLLFPFISMAQEKTIWPQKKDNLIIITTDTIDSQALDKSVKSLVNMGFTIREQNVEKGTVRTNAYDYKKGKLTLNILIDSNEIKIFGDFEPNLSLLSGDKNPKPFKDRIAFEGNLGSAVRDAWNIMDAYANQLTQIFPGSVSYAKW